MLEKIIKENWHKHFAIGVVIGIVFAVLTRNELRDLEAAIVAAVFTFFPATLWEWYFNRKNNAPISKADIIVSVLGGFVGSLVMALIL